METFHRNSSPPSPPFGATTQRQVFITAKPYDQEVTDHTSPYRPIDVSAGVRFSSLLIGEGGDEFAAEVGDVRDHAAPDQVKRGRETLAYVSDSHLGRPRMAPLARLV
jgi:hypothetical protein